MRTRVGVVLLAAASAACSAILGLEPPPGPDAGTDAGASADGTTGDASSNDSAVDADAIEAAAQDAPSITCAPLDASADSPATTFFPLDPTTDDSGAAVWEFFDTQKATGRASTTYGGGAFDGRYVYLAPHGSQIMRFDTGDPSRGAFESVANWSIFDVSALGSAGGFYGAVFDGRYVYFVPWQSGTTPNGLLARYDTKGSFASAASWTTFDLTSLSADGGASTTGFVGGVFDGRYVYFVPHADPTPDGRVVRLDTAPARDAGVPSDGSAPSAPLDDSSLWTAFDLSSVDPIATGFYGAVFDGTSIHFVPNANDAFGSVVHGGASGVAARFRLDAGFTAPSSWTSFDLTQVNGLASGFSGAAFDGRYAYLVPHTVGIAIRLDTKGTYPNLTSWTSYDVTRVTNQAVGTFGYTGAVFDGRFVYYVPGIANYGVVLRYDTASPFDADCAWSTVDLTAFGPDAGPPVNFAGGVFDGQYVYLVPVGRQVARFRAKGAPAMPALPAFYGSFL